MFTICIILVIFYISVLSHSQAVRSEQVVVAGITITSPPNVLPSHIAGLLRRTNNCSYGECAGTCLSQGAFCCNPGGTVFPPNWICDNGACITSVRGDAGIVDCYDPDNPLGTTQSCIDNKPTATCNPTDRCYTCESTEPYCHWQTWIASNSPTLRWFSCVTEKQTDATFIAALITASKSSVSSTTPISSTTSITPTSSTSSPSAASSSSSITAVSAVSSSSTTVAASSSSNSVILSTGAIAGIAVGGALLLIACIALAWYAFKRNRATIAASGYPQNQRPPPTAELASPVYSHQSTPGMQYSQMDEQARWQMLEDRYKTLVPVELPEQTHGHVRG